MNRMWGGVRRSLTCEPPDMGTTATGRGSTLAKSSAAPAPIEWPRTAIRRAST